jgi:hypothetical protein
MTEVPLAKGLKENGEPLGVDDSGSNRQDPHPLPPPFSKPLSPSAPPGYCPSYGGSTLYESITSVTLTTNPDGTMKLVVQIYIANPTGCTAGQPCPEYDEVPCEDRPRTGPAFLKPNL